MAKEYQVQGWMDGNGIKRKIILRKVSSQSEILLEKVEINQNRIDCLYGLSQIHLQNRENYGR